LPALTGSRFLHLPWRASPRSAAALAAALPRVALDLWTPWHEALVLDTLAGLTRHLPPGILSLDGLEAYIHMVLSRGGRTDDFRQLRRRLLIPATALGTGAIQVFGGRPGEANTPPRPVTASAAIPLVFAPVRIDDVDYVDACVTKSAHAGLAVEHGARLVVIINPIRPLLLEGTERGLRATGALGIASQSLR